MKADAAGDLGRSGLWVVAVNVSGWGTRKRLTPQLDPDVVLVQETKFITQLELLRERDWLATRG